MYSTVASLRAFDGLLSVSLQQSSFSGQALANLAVAMATEHSGATRGVLLMNQGDGLVEVLALRSDLPENADTEKSYDRNLVEQAATTRSVIRSNSHIAAPILLGSAVLGVLYLEASEAILVDDAEDLAEAVATRIASVLQSAELVDKLSRQTENMETLESLGACLAVGRLTPVLLQEALDAAVTATRSDAGLLGLLGHEGELRKLFTRGEEQPEVAAAGPRLAESVASGGTRDDAATMIGGPHLFEPLEGEQVVSSERNSLTYPLGFLAVSQPLSGSYEEMDSSFFKSLAHILAGAVSRHDYLKKAAEDPVTGTGSRLALQLTLSQLEASSSRTRTPLSVMVADVDRFKEINDSFGHPVGDEVLRAVGSILRSRLRAQDFVARYGGDEFVMLLPMTPIRGAVRLAEEVRKLTRAQPLTDKAIKVSLSAGIATFPTHTRDVADLLRLADQALYASKDAGRDRVTVAS